MSNSTLPLFRCAGYKTLEIKGNPIMVKLIYAANETEAEYIADAIAAKDLRVHHIPIPLRWEVTMMRSNVGASIET